ncbi:MAG: DUF2586 family protein [Paludibacteraceae bacterium]
MNNLEIIRQNGNVPRSLAGEDHITGFIAYLGAIPESFKENHVQAVSTIDTAEALGITADAESWEVKVLHYQLSEIFRVNPAISLYLGLFAKPDSYTFAEIKTVQNYADGRIRQLGIWCGDKEFSADAVVAIQGVAAALDKENAPLSVLYAPKVAKLSELPTDVVGANQSRVSVVIGQAGSGTGAELYASEENTGKSTVSCLGVVLGLLSAAAVHQSIGWVKQFPTGINLPAFGDGTLLRTIDKAMIEQLDTARYLFLVTKIGQTGSFVNDSHTMDAPTSDYAMIENVRTMDKAVRGIRTYLIPELGGNVYIDSSTGKLQPSSVAHLETTANRALEDMEKAGELSGYKVEIDPEQDVLSTSTVEIVIKQVAVGVMRKIKVKIGFYKSV